MGNGLVGRQLLVLRTSYAMCLCGAYSVLHHIRANIQCPCLCFPPLADNLRYAVRVWRAGTEDAAEAPVGGSDRGSLTDLEAGTATHAPTRTSTNRLSASFRFYDIYGGGSPSAGGTAPRPDVRDAGDGSGGNAGSAGSGEQCCVVS